MRPRIQPRGLSRRLMTGKAGAMRVRTTGRPPSCSRKPCRSMAARVRMSCSRSTWIRRPPSSESLVQATWTARFGENFTKSWHDALAEGVVSGTANVKSDVRLRADAAQISLGQRSAGATYDPLSPGPEPLGRSLCRIIRGFRNYHARSPSSSGTTRS